jgi:uncharacterized Zn-finger protein
MIVWNIYLSRHHFFINCTSLTLRFYIIIQQCDCVEVVYHHPVVWLCWGSVSSSSSVTVLKLCIIIQECDWVEGLFCHWVEGLFCHPGVWLRVIPQMRGWVSLIVRGDCNGVLASKVNAVLSLRILSPWQKFQINCLPPLPSK